METTITIDPKNKTLFNNLENCEITITCECEYAEAASYGNRNGHPDTWDDGNDERFEFSEFTWDKTLYNKEENKLIKAEVARTWDYLYSDFASIYKKESESINDI